MDEPEVAAPTVDVIVLTQGDRHDDTLTALETARAQEGVDVTLILVGNGWEPSGFPDDVRTIHLEENLGVPEGRNVGVAAGTSEFILFLDNDAWLPDVDLLSRAVAQMRAEPRLGLVQPRLCGPDGTTHRRWVPRARVGDPDVGGPAFAMCEGATIVRRAAYEDAGGFPGDFFFCHEGIELAWQLRDHGWELVYDPTLVMHHPVTEATRHEIFWRHTARNRVWVARRNLPWPLSWLYLLSWTLIVVLRTWRQPGDLRTWFAGFREGVTSDPGPRRPMRWRTVVRLARLGQPPLI